MVLQIIGGPRAPNAAKRCAGSRNATFAIARRSPALLAGTRSLAPGGCSPESLARQHSPQASPYAPTCPSLFAGEQIGGSDPSGNAYALASMGGRTGCGLEMLTENTHASAYSANNTLLAVRVSTRRPMSPNVMARTALW
ncbi:protein of unknown function [Hyphomicrobium sp. MC1]|nr:protein of unknown function [Hyphomicrobium sp. MC1]